METTLDEITILGYVRRAKSDTQAKREFEKTITKEIRDLLVSCGYELDNVEVEDGDFEERQLRASFFKHD